MSKCESMGDTQRLEKELGQLFPSFPNSLHKTGCLVKSLVRLAISKPNLTDGWKVPERTEISV